VSYRGEGTMDRRRFLWDWIDEHHPEAFETRGYPMLKSPSLQAEAVSALVEHLGITRLVAWQRRLPETVERWLDNPDRHSPHVDEIALELALGFDWDAIAGLSLAEYDVLLNRLGAMCDPLGGNMQDRTTDEYGGPPALMDVSLRRLAYLKGSAKQRQRLALALARKRMQAAAVAA